MKPYSGVVDWSNAPTLLDPLPERRKACSVGSVRRFYGRLATQALLGTCLCHTWESCPWCGQQHVFVELCEVCASRAP